MKTELGKELRKLRIDHDERLLDMSQKIGKSAAFISAVETGHKSPPTGFEEMIVRVYGLTKVAADRLRIAADRSREVFTISADTIVGRDTAGLLARKMNTLTDDQLEEIKLILKRGKEE
ncbi:helix-turn-helix domain-containing protein [Phyllobacterium calauticae]|uniref:helix-turn-helix domain-containing protein n=1 Tax=Phyllobacterium calauticae TaxID=2817027 RepID=UPI001CBBBC10|nr:helix-turn-helix domain-containing protein [Phyllobacterium calauticae]MBZ3693394.1 helix-turn-helix domain-containing protein [Phyllobacterium calauticae]